jgi:phosphatidylglycerophosphatase A
METNDRPPVSLAVQFGRTISIILATGFTAGFIPWMPGTFGAAEGLFLAVELGHWGLATQAVAIVVLLAVSVPICTAAARQLGRGHDPGCIVLDEIVSMGITFFGVPMTSWWIVLAGFALHRLFDITKPPPARQLERLPTGLGVMADDVAAGVYSNLALRVVVWLFAL